MFGGGVVLELDRVDVTSGRRCGRKVTVVVTSGLRCGRKVTVISGGNGFGTLTSGLASIELSELLSGFVFSLITTLPNVMKLFTAVNYKFS